MRLVRSDMELLASLADLRAATIRQLAILLGRNAHAMQRRLRALEHAGHVEVLSRTLVARRGRPENVLGVTGAGLEVINAPSRSAVTATEPSKQIHLVEHQLLINDFRVQLSLFPRVVTEMSVRYFSAEETARCEMEATEPSEERKTRSRATPRQVDFIPDGVFALSHTGVAKTLLFFLEADRGTEPRISAHPRRATIQSKLTAYRQYSINDKYKHLEKTLSAKLNGFRLLFLANGTSRLMALCELVRAAHRADFVWLTDSRHLHGQGCWAAIWIVGGKVEDPRQSILGSKTPSPCPTPTELNAM